MKTNQVDHPLHVEVTKHIPNKDKVRGFMNGANPEELEVALQFLYEVVNCIHCKDEGKSGTPCGKCECCNKRLEIAEQIETTLTKLNDSLMPKNKVKRSGISPEVHRSSL